MPAPVTTFFFASYRLDKVDRAPIESAIHDFTIADLHPNLSAVTKWALACVVFAGTVSGGLYQNHQRLEAAKVEAARIAEQQRELEAAKLAMLDEEDLMANVDSDVARQVPSALQPLATLMTEDEAQGN